MTDDPRRHHSPREELEHAIEAIHEIERRAIRLGKRRIPLPRKRTLLAVAFVFVLLLAAGLFVLTRTAVTRSLVLPRLGGVLAVNADASRVVIEPDGRLVIEDLTLRAPGVRGPAAEFLGVGALEATLDWSALLGGRVVVNRLKLTDPVATLSQHRRTGRLNVAGLALVSGKESAGAPVLPEIESEGAQIVIAEHDDDGMHDLRRLALDADSGLTRVGDAYELALTETGQPEGRAPMRVRGRMDDTGLEIALDALTLEQWAGDGAPTRVRELLDTIALEGELSGANLRYGADGDVTLRIDLDGVALTLPVGAPAEAPPGPGGVGPRMTGVSGSITFERTGVRAALVGAIEGVPFDVTLDYGEFGPDAPFRATLRTEDYWLEGQPDVLRYAPRVVRWRLESFGFPSAAVDATVMLSRGEAAGGARAPLEFEGVVSFEDGTAAYHWFPYEFQRLAGTIRLTNEAMTIERITGVAPSGARITAEGTIAPPAPGAEVDLRIAADGVPVDDALIGALGEHRRKLIHALFNEERYEELIDEGLVLSPARAAALGEERDEAERRAAAAEGEARARWLERAAAAAAALETPVFAPGGVARVDVRILRALGADSEFERRIEVRMPHAGVLPEHFPLPIDARDLTMVILNDDLWLEDGAFSALRGGAADVTIEADLGPGENGEPKPFAPTITVNARGVPIDDLLIHAIPGPRDRRTAAEAGASVQQILTDLRLEGVGDCVAYIAPRTPGTDDLGFDVRASFAGVAARPRRHGALAPGVPRIALKNVTGGVHVTERALDLNLSAEARSIGTDGAAGGGLGRLELAADVTFPRAPGADPVFATDVQGAGVDLEGAFEDVVAIFSAQAGEILTDLRAQRDPRGRVALGAEIRSDDDGPPVHVRVTLRDLRGASFDAAGGRLELGETAGSLRVDTSEGPRVTFDAFAATIAFDGEPAGVVAVSGVTPIGLADDHDATADAMALDVELRSGRFDSGLVRSISTTRLGDGFAAFYEAIEPGGVFDLGLTAQPTYEEAEPGEPVPLRIGGVIRPRSFELTRRGERIRFAPVEGLVEFGRFGGAFTRVRGVSDGWTIAGDGEWATPEGGDFRITTDFSIEAAGVPAGLRAALPSPLVGAMDDLEMAFGGLVRVAETTLTATLVDAGERGPGDEGEWLFETAGRVAFADASLVVGAPVDRADGSARFTASRGSLEEPVSFEVRLTGDRARVAGVRTTGATAQVRSGAVAGSVVVPLLAADCHGGRMSGDARAFPLESGEGVRYEANLRASGVGLASVIDDLEAAAAEAGAEGEAGLERATSPPANAPLASDPPPAHSIEGLAGADRSRGLLDGRLGLVGRTGPKPTRQGSGLVQASGGRVLELPLVLRLIEVSNLTAPSGEDLDFGRASVLIEGDRVTFEDISVFSRTVEILGYGELDWPTKALDLRFNSRASRRIPVISDVLEGVRDELISTEVVGTVGAPVVRLAPLSGTRNALGRILGDRSERDRRMDEIARRARIEREAQSREGVRRPIVGEPVDGSP